MKNGKFLEEFKIEKQKLRSAFRNMLTEAKNAAEGKGEYATYEDVFAEEGMEDKSASPKKHCNF